MLLHLVVDRGDLGAHRDELILGLLPIALGDQGLHLAEFGLGGQPDLVVTDLLLPAEQHGADPVECVTRAGPGDHGAEPADA